MKRLFLGAAVGVAALAFGAASASAAVVCSENVCWHATEKYDYPAEAKVKIYEDNWKPAPGVSITWRERTGRGYWRGENWVTW